MSITEAGTTILSIHGVTVKVNRDTNREEGLICSQNLSAQCSQDVRYTSIAGHGSIAIAKSSKYMCLNCTKSKLEEIKELIAI